jgi:thioredoxin reductase (NADPH)
MTAGMYAARARLDAIVVEKLSPGGQILTTDWVDNYPGFPEGVSGFELVDRMRKQAERFGLRFSTGEVTGLSREGDLVRTTLYEGEIFSKALIIATGSQPIKLGVPGEDRMIGKGVSFCATCDGPFYRNVEVAVVGGGDTAVEEALYLTRFASRVHLFHRRDRLRAAAVLREKIVSDPKVEIHWSSVLTSIAPDDRGLVKGVVYRDLRAGRETSLDLEGVFMFVGQRPVTEFARGFVDLSDNGFIVTDSEMAASQPGVWAAGDVRVKLLRQVSTAVGDGATAGYAAEKYIEEKFGQSRGAQ